MVMKCPQCGAENPDGKRFCGECGVGFSPPYPVQPTQSTYGPPPRPSWIHLNWRGLVAVIVVVIVALSAMSLVYSQNWSKIVVYIDNHRPYNIYVGVYIDGELVGAQTIGYAQNVDLLVERNVKPGTHTVAVEVSLSGVMNPYLSVKVGPLYTKEVWLDILR